MDLIQKILFFFKRRLLLLSKIVWVDINDNEKALLPLTFFNLSYNHPHSNSEHPHRIIPIYIRIALLFFEGHFWVSCVIWWLIVMILKENNSDFVVKALVVIGLFLFALFFLRLAFNNLLTELLLFKHGELTEVEIESEEIYDSGPDNDEDPSFHIICLKYRNAQGISTYVRIPAPGIFKGFRKYKPQKKYLVLYFHWDKTQVIFYKSLRIPYKLISIKSLDIIYDS